MNTKLRLDDVHQFIALTGATVLDISRPREVEMP